MRNETINAFHQNNNVHVQVQSMYNSDVRSSKKKSDAVETHQSNSSLILEGKRMYVSQLYRSQHYFPGS